MRQGRVLGAGWTVCLGVLLTMLASCDDDEGDGDADSGDADSGGGDTSNDAGADVALPDQGGDATPDVPAAESVAGSWLALIDGSCGMTLVQNGSTVTGTFYGDGAGETYELEGSVSGTSFTGTYSFDDTVIQLELQLFGESFMGGTLSDGESTLDLNAARTHEAVLTACTGGAPVTGVTDGWIGIGLDGFCGLELTESGGEITGTIHGDQPTETFDLAGTLTGSVVALTYEAVEGYPGRLDLTLDSEGILLTGTLDEGDGSPLADVGFARALPGTAEECANLD